MKKIICLFLVCLASKVFSSKIADAYAALSIYDYFKAKQLFIKSLPKFPAEASYGLATIYYRNDNPFSNIDSAAKYISKAKTLFRDTVSYSLYHINKKTINTLSYDIAQKGFEKYSKLQTAKAFDHYLVYFRFANDSLLSLSYTLRDELQYNYYNLFESSDSIKVFLLKYPESNFYTEAKNMFCNYQYTEKVNETNITQLKYFIKNYQSNTNVARAELKLFDLTKQLHLTDSLYSYIKIYSSNLTKEEAWKALYSQSVKGYNKQELTAFLNKYPDYPYNESVLREISLAQQILIPFKNLNEKYGFIDTLGQWKIVPQYDDASEYSEGFAAVCKNDSCYYINKEGNKISDFYFEETENYINGIAIIKKENNYYLINRSGQLISKGYQDISKASNNLFVCKLNNVYGAINAKGEIIIPFMYNKLGKFKNGFAYYLSTYYGLVDVNNKALKAQWDWTSDVDSNKIVIVKKENKFGLMTLDEQLLLPTHYDYIAPCLNGIYLLVKNSLYGFYNSKEKCFVTNIEFNYNSAFEPIYYTNGRQFKLIKDKDVDFIDANGKNTINSGSFTNIFFAKDDIIRVQKNNKFGFIDKKLKAITPVEFEKASDFENDLAIVTKGVNALLIDKAGKAVYTLKDGEISLFEDSYYLTEQNELLGLLSRDAKPLLNMEFSSIELIYPGLFRCEKNKELFLYNSSTNTLKKI